MKRLAILTTILLFSFKAHSQFQSVLKDTNQYWRIYENQLLLYYYAYSDSLYIKDTLIYNNKTYTKLWSTYHSRSYSIPYYYGLLREDTVNGKLWYLNDTFNFGPQEELVYDFSLLPGDTFRTGFGNGRRAGFIMDTIFKLNGRTHAKLHIINDSLNIYYPFIGRSGFSFAYDTLEFIEGVGNSFGFTYSQQVNLFSLKNDYSQYLLCHTKNGIQNYQHNLDTNVISFIRGCDTISPPNIITSIPKSQTFLESNFFPNPSTGIVNLKTTEGLKEIRVFTINGQLLNKYNIESTIHLPEEGGIYLIEAVYHNKIVRREKIIRTP